MTPRPTIRMDVGPLRRSRDFRLLFSSGLITSIGSMMTFVAVPFQIATITDSFIAVGLVGVVELIPLVIFALYGGSLADRLDKRRIVVVTEVIACALALALTINAALPEPRVGVIYVIAILFAAVDGLQRPSLDALLPRVVDHDDLSAAGALNSFKGSASAIVGPALAGVVLAIWGPAAAYGIDAVSFIASFILLTRLRPVPPVVTVVTVVDTSHAPDNSHAPGNSHAPDNSHASDNSPSSDSDASIQHIIAGLRYAWSRKDLLGTYAIDLAAMMFAFPFALFPFVAQEYDAPWALGFLYAAGFVGALAFTVTSGWAPRIRHQGRAIALAATLWGAAIGCIAFAPTIWWVLLFLVVAGYFDMFSGHFRMLIWNQSIPDDMRGRLAGIEMLSYSIGPMVGQVRSTTAAQLTSLRASFLTGGIACIAAVGVVCATMPALWRYDATTDHNVASVRRLRAQHNQRDDTHDE